MILQGSALEKLLSLGLLALKENIKFQSVVINTEFYTEITQELGSKAWKDENGILQFVIALRNGNSYIMKVIEGI